MKKVYKRPEAYIHQVQLQQMIAQSDLQMGGQATKSEVLSRQGTSIWDDDEYDDEY
jgi:hypothetical protein